MTFRFVGLPCCLTIICDYAFLPTPAQYNVKHPKFGCHVTSLCQGLRRSAGSGDEDPENQVDHMIKECMRMPTKEWNTVATAIMHLQRCAEEINKEEN